MSWWCPQNGKHILLIMAIAYAIKIHTHTITRSSARALLRLHHICGLLAICGTLSKNRETENTKHQMGNIVFCVHQIISHSHSVCVGSIPKWIIFVLFGQTIFGQCRIHYAGKLVSWKLPTTRHQQAWFESGVAFLLLLLVLLLILLSLCTSRKWKVVGVGRGGMYTSDRFHFVLFPFLFSWHVSSVLLIWYVYNTNRARTHTAMDSGHKRGKARANSEKHDMYLYWKW